MTDRLLALERRLQALGTMALAPEAATLVAEALRDARALLADSAGDVPLVDRTTFDTLLALAGPQVAPELLRQLTDDLAGVATALSRALDAADAGGVRGQAHVLMALAGSIGAMPLYAAASRLHKQAQTGGDMRAEGAGVVAGLADVRRFIDHTRQTFPARDPG